MGINTKVSSRKFLAQISKSYGTLNSLILDSVVISFKKLVPELVLIGQTSLEEKLSPFNSAKFLPTINR